jgi:glutamate synthase domain-containing protein 3
MVDLKPLHEKSIPELRRCSSATLQYTGSTGGAAILDNWERNWKKFVRVMPRDYARVLAEEEAQRGGAHAAR